MTQAKKEGGGVSSGTRAAFAGDDVSQANVIDYITIASTGNASDFGDLTAGRSGVGAVSSKTRGVWGGGTISGTGAVNTMDYVTIASTGNATDFGDRTLSVSQLTGLSNGHGGL